MSALHDWHRHEFQKRHTVTVVWPARSTMFGGNYPEERREVTHCSARTVIAQRILNALTPAERAKVQAAFDASDAAKDLTITRQKRELNGAGDLVGVVDEAGEPVMEEVEGDRAEMAQLWFLHRLHTDDHRDMVAPTELALNVVMDHHATPAKVRAHRARHLHPKRLAEASKAVAVPENPPERVVLTPDMVRTGPKVTGGVS